MEAEKLDLSPMNKALVEINEHLTRKDTYSFLINGRLPANSNSFVYNLSSSLKLKDNASYIGFVKFFTSWQNIPNVISGVNNVFTYIVPPTTASNTTGSPVSKTILIPQGACQITDISNYINLQMESNGDWNSAPNATNPHYIDIGGNLPTQQILIKLYNGFKVDFTVPNSINTLFGFDSRVLSNSLNYSDKLVDILPTQNITSSYSICSGFYNKYGNQSNILYSFPNDTPSGYMISQKPNPVIPVLINTRNIDSMVFYFASQDGTPISFQGEEFSIVMVIEQR